MEKRIIITISRQYGSGGRLIGRKLAEQLEIPFLDRQLITDAASQCGLDEDAVERLEEKTTSSLLYALSGGYATAAMVGDRVDMLPMNDRGFYVQANLIRKAAREGSCVIVGRCADYILRNNPDAVHVYIHAELSVRIQRGIQYYGLTSEKAESVLLRMDRQRASYHNFYSDRKWGKAENYDLCINSGIIGLDHTVEVIRNYAKMKRVMRKEAKDLF